MSPTGAADKLRHSLDLGEESVDEDGDAQTAPRKHRRKTVDDFPDKIQVQLDGVRFFVQPTLRPLRVELTCPAVQAVVRFCQRHVQKGIVLQCKKSRKAPAPSGAFSMPGVACPPITGKVTWQPSLLAWAVHYKNSSGKQGFKRFSVPKNDEAQPPSFLPRTKETNTQDLSAQESFNERRLQKYYAACLFWNTEDHSTRDRIDVSHLSS